MSRAASSSGPRWTAIAPPSELPVHTSAASVGLGIEVSIAVGAVIGFLIANALLYQYGGRATR